MRTAGSEIGAHERRPAERLENSAFPGRLAGDALADGSAKVCDFRSILCQPFREGANEIAIGAKSEDFEAGQAALGEAIAELLDRAFLRRGAHSSPPMCNR
jgi:hypothetical protein